MVRCHRGSVHAPAGLKTSCGGCIPIRHRSPGYLQHNRSPAGAHVTCAYWLYDYRFTTAEERERSGTIWSTQFLVGDFLTCRHEALNPAQRRKTAGTQKFEHVLAFATLHRCGHGAAPVLSFDVAAARRSNPPSLVGHLLCRQFTIERLKVAARKPTGTRWFDRFLRQASPGFATEHRHHQLRQAG